MSTITTPANPALHPSPEPVKPKGYRITTGCYDPLREMAIRDFSYFVCDSYEECETLHKKRAGWAYACGRKPYPSTVTHPDGIESVIH